jgi:hypothetical protein
MLCLDPLYSLPIQPLSMSFLATLILGVDEYTDSVLAVISPAADVHGSVSPCESSFSILLAILKITFVAAAIVPCLNSTTLNRTEPEFSLIELIYICEIVLAVTLELTIHKFSFVVASICPFEASLTLFFAFVELTDVASATAIVPCFFANAMLRII